MIDASHFKLFAFFFLPVKYPSTVFNMLMRKHSEICRWVLYWLNKRRIEINRMSLKTSIWNYFWSVLILRQQHFSSEPQTFISFKLTTNGQSILWCMPKIHLALVFSIDYVKIESMIESRIIIIIVVYRCHKIWNI